MKITIEISDTVAQALSQHWTQASLADIIIALAIAEAKAVQEAAQ